MNDLIPIVNERGEEITKPLLFYTSTPNYVGYIAKKEIISNVTDNGRTVLSFTPSKDFSFQFSKDSDCNIDIWIHTNPRNIINNIGGIFKGISDIRKYCM